MRGRPKTIVPGGANARKHVSKRATVLFSAYHIILLGQLIFYSEGMSFTARMTQLVSAMRRHSRLGQFLALCLATLPAVLSAVLIWKYSVDIPQWDQWELVSLFEKLSDGTLSPADLFAQQNDHRQFFPNLLFVGLGWLTRWDVRYEMLVSFLLACLISLNVYRLSKITVSGGGWWQRLALFLMSNLLIFSPMQYENWLFGIQVIYYVPIACLTTSILLAHSSRSARAKWLGCICLATVSTFSSANGVLCWLLIPPVLVWARPQDKEGIKGRWILVWLLCAVLTSALYLYGYTKSPQTPNPMEPLFYPLRALTYFLAVLGSLFGVGRNPLAVALVAGSALISFLVLFCLYIRRFSGDSALVSRVIGWLMIAFYSVLTVVMITFGRVGFGLGHSLTSRYTTFALYLAVALVHLLPIILEDSKRRGYLSRISSFIPGLISLAAVLLTLMQTLILVSIVRNTLIPFQRELLRAKACLLFTNIVYDDCVKGLYWHADVVKQRANALNRLGYLRPALIENSKVRDIEAAGATYGSFDVLKKTDGGDYAASGWAFMSHAGRPADAVLLAYGDGAGNYIVFALAGSGDEIFSDNSGPGEGAPQGARWHRDLHADNFPPAATKLRAWAFDAQTGKAYPLSGEHTR